MWIRCGGDGFKGNRQRGSAVLCSFVVCSSRLSLSLSRCFVALAVSLAHILLLRGPQYLLHISFVSLVHHFLSLREERRD